MILHNTARRALVTLGYLLLATVAAGGQWSVADLNDAGWKALRNDNPDRAAALFAEALSMRPNDAILLFGAGSAEHARGNAREAMARLKKALELRPGLTEASQLLGDIAFSEGESDLAIKIVESGLKYAPYDATLKQQLASFKRETSVHNTFEERRYDRFRVMFEGRTEESLAAKTTSVLNTAFWRIGSALGAYPSEPVTTVLYTEKQFRDITRAPDWSNGQYDGRIRVPVAGAELRPDLFERVLTHELSHAIVHRMAPRGVPTWINEGLAQYFEGSDPEDALRRLRAGGRVVPLRVLDGGFGRLDARSAQIAYDESLVAVASIFERTGFAWNRLLPALGERGSIERTLESFGLSYADLDATFSR